MAFKRISPLLSNFTTVPVKATLRYSERLDRTKLFLTLSKDVMEGFGATRPSAYFIEEGEGEDRGVLRITPGNGGDFKGRPTIKSAGWIFEITNLTCAPKTAQSQRRCGYEFKNGVLYVTLPAWARLSVYGETPKGAQVKPHYLPPSTRETALKEGPDASYLKAREIAEGGQKIQESKTSRKIKRY